MPSAMKTPLLFKAEEKHAKNETPSHKSLCSIDVQLVQSKTKELHHYTNIFAQSSHLWHSSNSTKYGC